MSPSAPHILARGPRRKAVTLAAIMLPVFAGIHLAAYWLRFEGQLSGQRWQQLYATLLGALIIKTVVFLWNRIYHSWNRYLTFYDMVALFQAATLSSTLLVLFDYLFLAKLHIPRSVFLMDWGATLVTLGALRSSRRWMVEANRLCKRSTRQVPVLIIGVDDYGEGLLRAIRCNANLNYEVVGFIAESRHGPHSRIGGVSVLGTVDQTCELAERLGVQNVLIASPDLTGKQIRELMQNTTDRGIDIKVLPSYEQLLDGRVDMRPRTVSIADLLRRDPVKLDMQNLHRWLDRRVLLVTGAAGSIGSEICRQLLQFAPRKLVLVDRSENGQFFLEQELLELAKHTEIVVCIGDTCDAARMRGVFDEHRPDIVFHAAAYKHVPMMERNCGEAIKNIPLATRTLADLSDEFHVRSFVMISTDKAVNPTSIMGASKRVAELYVQALARHSACRFVTVRFGNVLDSAGSVVPIFREQIARGGPVTVTHPDMKRYFMMIPEASQLVIQAGAMGKGGEIFVLDMGEPVRILDLAQDMIRLSGLRVDEDIEIQVSGIRPGEKLFEELHIHGEEHVPTSHPKIMVATCNEISLGDMEVALDRLSLISNGESQQIREQLSQLVPQYQAPEPPAAAAGAAKPTATRSTKAAEDRERKAA